ncbi:MAG: c-type cytochrome biogenesis protein CcmI [Rhodospirillaceae bacterium]|nr:c-type cytochrome biogenesis protein CcmI [Rhodospirillaceae bacterium]
MLWIILIIMTISALAIILIPYFKNQQLDRKSIEYIARFYRGQLRELESDIERGMIGKETAKTARTEIERNLLAENSKEIFEEHTENTISRKFIFVIILFMVPFLSFGLYGITGSPNLPSQLYNYPKETNKTHSDKLKTKLEKFISILNSRLQENPNDFKSWQLYARSLGLLGHYKDAIAAYNRAITLAPRGTNLFSELAEAQINAANGTVDKFARINLEKSLTLDPFHPLTRYYVGLAAKQAGKLEDALKIWLELQISINKNVHWRKILTEQVTRLSKTMGISEKTLASMRKNMKDKIQRKIK